MIRRKQVVAQENNLQQFRGVSKNWNKGLSTVDGHFDGHIMTCQLFQIISRSSCKENTLKETYACFVVVIQSQLGCPSNLVLIRNNQNWNRNQFWHYPKQNVCFGCFASITKQKSNQNSLIWSIFWYFFRKFRVFPIFFGLFGFVSKQFVSVVSLLY